jgi:hypothetical protein
MSTSSGESNPATQLPLTVQSTTIGEAEQTASQVDKVNRAVAQYKLEVQKAIKMLDRNAAYWRDKDKSGMTIIQAYTLTATVVMGVNLILKHNVNNVGGWLPFCIAAAVLTAIATHFANSQASEAPRTHRDHCLVLRSQYRGFVRELIAKTWTEARIQNFENRYRRLEKEASLYLIRSPRINPSTWYWILLPVVVVVYLGYEGLYLTGHLEGLLSFVGKR